MKPVITWQERRAQIKTLEDVELQITKARNYRKRLEAIAKAYKGQNEQEKETLENRAKHAYKEERLLCRHSFDIEDEIRSA